MNLKQIYQGKKVFVTGHTGFKGSWLITWLYLLGAEVKGYALPPLPENALYQQIKGDKICESVLDDILNYNRLEKSMLDFQPDFIFHLAAQAIVRQSYHTPLETFNVNVMGTAYVLEAVKKLKKPCVVVMVTTDKVYYNYEWHYPYRETDRLGGYDPYSASKACAELVIDSFRNSFFNIKEYPKHHKSIVVARAGNVIGGGDWAKDRIIPDIIRSLKTGIPIAIRNPLSVRPWQHVMEPIGAYLLLGGKLSEDPFRYSTEYNIGPLPTDCWEVEKMVKAAIDVWGYGDYNITGNQFQPHEAGLLKLDISKASNELHWVPRYTAQEAIEKTIRWYKNFDEDNAYELVKDDIISFSGKTPPSLNSFTA